MLSHLPLLDKMRKRDEEQEAIELYDRFLRRLSLVVESPRLLHDEVMFELGGYYVPASPEQFLREICKRVGPGWLKELHRLIEQRLGMAGIDPRRERLSMADAQYTQTIPPLKYPIDF